MPAPQKASETKSQIHQMTQFILNEAKDKAEEISTKALQEFSVEKAKVLEETKEKIRQEFQRKGKQEETKAAIANSTAINRSRIEKILARQDKIQKIADISKGQVVDEMKDEKKKTLFVTNLIVQGLLMLLEDEVEVRCRACDEKLVTSCLDAAAKKYAEVVKTEANLTKTCKVTLGSEKLAPAPGGEGVGPTCLGGVVLACQGGAITIDNTIDSRLALIMEQAKPTIRKLLFSK